MAGSLAAFHEEVITMSRWNSRVWGPHPKYAILPALCVLGVVGWLAYRYPEPIDSPRATAVTTMKPVEGTASAPVSATLPMEVLYGVPTVETMHLWPGPHQRAK